VTTQAGLRRIDLRAVVGSDRVGIDINQITFNTDYKVGAAFVCTGGREALVTYSGDDPVSSLDDRSLNCGFGRRGESILGAMASSNPDRSRTGAGRVQLRGLPSRSRVTLSAARA
jgi:hypothetical protein